MAVYAVHLTRTLQGAPSIFQVAAAESLGNTLKPALQRVIEYLGSNQSKWSWCVRWNDELFLMLDLWLQHHYLQYHAASFSESFYGLMRVPTKTDEINVATQLSSRIIRNSLFILVLIPYLRDKLDALITRWIEENEMNQIKNITSELKRAAIRVYTIAHFVWRLGAGLQLGLYATGRSPYATLGLRFLNLTLSPTTLTQSLSWRDLFAALRSRNLLKVYESLAVFGEAVLTAAQYGAFLVQFLGWWQMHYTEKGSLPVPPPPPRDETVKRWMNKCPVCLKPWRAPTALTVSGLVFCYGCVSRALKERGVCPATALPATHTELVRLYIT